MRFIAPKVVEKAADKIYRDMKNQEASQSRHSVRKGDMTIDFSDKNQSNTVGLMAIISNLRRLMIKIIFVNN